MSVAAPLPLLGNARGYAMNGTHGADGWKGGEGADDGRGTTNSQPQPAMADIVAAANERVDGARFFPVRQN